MTASPSATSTRATTRTASEGHAEQVGVCRDFAHLAVTLCRCMNIPARYCTGYLGDIGIPLVDAPMDYSAWFEVYLDGRWFTFDARHNYPRIGRIVMARGRDATRCGDLHLVRHGLPQQVRRDHRRGDRERGAADAGVADEGRDHVGRHQLRRGPRWVAEASTEAGDRRPRVDARVDPQAACILRVCRSGPREDATHPDERAPAGPAWSGPRRLRQE